MYGNEWWVSSLTPIPKAPGAAALANEAAAVAWIHDAYAHCKVIGATQESIKIVEEAGASPDEGVLTGTNANSFFEAASHGRIWTQEPRVRATY